MRKLKNRNWSFSYVVKILSSAAAPTSGHEQIMDVGSHPDVLEYEILCPLRMDSSWLKYE